LQQAAKRVAVVGAGLGGISAAISLAQEGYAVTLFDKNRQIGGKLNELKADGFTFDLGPSILTLPHLFRRLFERSGKRMEDYVAIRPLRPHWRNFFEDGTVVDLHPEPDKMAAQLAKIGEDPADFQRFLKYSADLYELINEGFFEQGLDNSAEFRDYYGLWRFPGFDLFRNMHQSVARHVKTRYMRDILDYFIKYVGSSAYRAPAFMNCLPHIQFEHDLWYVDGGLYNIARGLGRLLEEVGVEVRLGAEIEAIRKVGGRVDAVQVRGEEPIPFDVVVSNMEVVPAYTRLLKEDPEFLRGLERFEPACSGLILDIGVEGRYPQLAHHNFLYSNDQKKHFETVFRKRELPADPTIYLVAASRSDPSVAPDGCECLKILPHIPYIDEQRPLTRDDYAAFRDVVLDKLERMGLRDLSKRTIFEHFWTPLDIAEQYYSNKGSIYGVVSDRWKNLGFKAPKQSVRYENLFFVGGSVNPGGGMPMVVLCGQNVARKIVGWDRGKR
jgi:diapolycopene oxygenase